MSKEMTGVVVEIFPVKEISPKLSIREFHFKTDDEYPQDHKIQTINGKMSLLDNLSAGDIAKVKYNLKGRLKDGKFYTTVEAWAIDAPGKKASTSGGSTTKQAASKSKSPVEDEDDMPF